MSWFDDILGPLIGVGGNLIGAAIGSNANQNAANTVAQSNAQAAQIYADAQQRGLDQYTALINQAMNEATAYDNQATSVYGGMAAESQPAISYLRGVAFSDPYQLTPQQQSARADTLRDASNNLAASGLRGAGRSGVAVLNKAMTDFDNNAYTSNRNRADAANSQLYGENVNANNNIAATDRQTGSARANMLAGQGTAAMQSAQNTGTFAANAAQNTGQTAGNADTADASQWGSAIGAIGSIIANNQKNLFGNYSQPNNNQSGGLRNGA
jgi:hypothetical protein